MAFPSPVGTPTTYSDNSGTVSNHPVTLPAGMTVGNKLFILFIANGSPTVTDPSGYTPLGSNATPATYDSVRLYGRDIDGSEGSTVSINLSANQRASAISWEASGGRAGFTSSEVAVSAFSELGNVRTPNPPSLSPVPGADDYLWVAMCTRADSNATFTSYPTNYSLGQQNVITGSAGNANALAVAMRQLNASSEDPDVFTWSTAKFSVGITIAIRPAAAVATDPFKVRDFANPTAPARGISLRSHINPVALNLIGQDKFFGAPGQGPVYDYPNPKAPLRGIELRNWINTQIPPTVTFPAVSAFWAYSQPARPVTQTWLNTFIPPAAASPIVPVIWSSPARAGQAPQFWALNLQETTLSPAAAVPFKWQEWRAPGPKAGGERSWAVNLLLTTLAPTPTVPADCGHLYPSVSAAGQSTASVSASGASRGTVSKGGSLKSEIPC